MYGKSKEHLSSLHPTSIYGKPMGNLKNVYRACARRASMEILWENQRTSIEPAGNLKNRYRACACDHLWNIFTVLYRASALDEHLRTFIEPAPDEHLWKIREMSKEHPSGLCPTKRSIVPAPDKHLWNINGAAPNEHLWKIYGKSKEPLSSLHLRPSMEHIYSAVSSLCARRASMEHLWES